MNRKFIPMVTMAFLIAMLPAFASAQSTAPTTGPVSDVTIICDADYYAPDVFGNIDIYCDITNDGVPVKALQAGAVFDDYVGEDVEFLEVNVDGSPITCGLTKLPPQAQKVRSEVLSNQVVTIASGATRELHFKVKVPFGMTGKFDVLFGEYTLDPWINVSWQYKKCYNLSGHTQNLTGDSVDMPYGYPFNLTLNTQSAIGASKMQADCDDIRAVFNDTDYVKFFTRDCGATVTEVWGAWNFTVGESYDFCVYYGNPTAVSNETDATDIVFEWQDFNDASAFNWSEWSTRRACQNGGSAIDYGTVNGTNNAFGIDNGTLIVRQPSGCSGNSGAYIWRNDTTYNISKTGLLSESNFKYTEGCGPDYSPHVAVLSPRNPDHFCWDTTNYGTLNCNGTIFLHIFLSGSDYQIYGYTSTQHSITEGWQNTSNLYTSRNFWERSGWKIMPNGVGNYNVTAYGAYGGQPWYNDIVLNFLFGTSASGYFIYDDFVSGMGLLNTLEVGSSKGCSGGEHAWYDFLFARPYQEGEPNAVGGAEVPLDNGTLSIQYVSPTPANGTTTTNLTATINVSSNKTIEFCKLNWGGTNYTMTTDTSYCYIDQLLSGSPVYYDVFVEDFWGYQDTTPQRVITGTDYSALLGVGFDIADFNISSDTYVTGANMSFNTSAVSTDLILMTSMNVKKETSTGTNAISAKVIVDGTPIVEEVIRTVDTVGEEGSTGISPTVFNVSAGPHYIQIEFKRTGNGVISINDIDASLGQLVTTNGGTVYGNVSSGNFTHNSTSFAQALNFTIMKPGSSDMFMSTKITVGSDGATLAEYQYQNLDNLSQTSPFGARYISGPTDIGSMSSIFIDYFPVGDINMTILAKSSTGANVSANFTNILFELEDNYTKTVDNFQVTNPNTDNDSSLNITDTWTLLGNATQTVQVGDGYFVGFYGYYKSNSGSQTVTHMINATGTSCTSKKERYLSDNTDVGLTYIYFICDNLSASSTYDFQLWAKAGSGKTFDQYDESFAGFEVNSFNTSESYLPPIPGIITNPVNGSDQTTSVNVTWTPWTDVNSDFNDYNISLLNADSSFNSTVIGSTTNEYAVIDIISLPSGTIFGAEVNGCDDQSLCTNQTIYFVVQNLPTYTEFSSDPETTNFSAVPDLQNVTEPVLANTYAKVAWSGYGYDVAGADLDSAISYAHNLVDVDTTTIPTFDAPATVTLKGVTYISTSQYRVLRDGVECTTCVKLSSTPATFTVPGFSNYTTQHITATEQQPMLAVIPLIIAVALIIGFAGAFLSGLLDLKNALMWIVMAGVAIVIIGTIFII